MSQAVDRNRIEARISENDLVHARGSRVKSIKASCIFIEKFVNAAKRRHELAGYVFANVGKELPDGFEKSIKEATNRFALCAKLSLVASFFIREVREEQTQQSVNKLIRSRMQSARKTPLAATLHQHANQIVGTHLAILLVALVRTAD